MEQKTRIIVAEDQEIVRKSLIALLKTNSEIEVVADAANGKELLQHLKQKPVDIVLLDTDMQIMDGKASLKIIHSRFPKIRVIILSAHSDIERRSDFMVNGANSYLSKNCDVSTLFSAIQKVKGEGYFFENSTSQALLASVLKDRERSSLSSEPRLNAREMEILKQICDGYTNKEIANELSLSTSTIDFYRTRIYNKTQCHNATKLLKYALRNGLVALS